MPARVLERDKGKTQGFQSWEREWREKKPGRSYAAVQGAELGTQLRWASRVPLVSSTCPRFASSTSHTDIS